MIPRVIHYCWFGRNPKPPLVLFCISTWKRFCPDYDIVEWNEDNFEIAAYPYTAESYAQKKWAFVTDFVRLWVLYHYGGVYMDTDVQTIKPLDQYLENRGFSGFETPTSVPTGIMASEAKNLLIGDLLHEYLDKHFLLPNGENNLENNVIFISRLLKKRGLDLNNTQQTIADFMFYPTRFFCPKSVRTLKFEISPDTVAIHHFSGSWTGKNRNGRRVDDTYSRLFFKFPPTKAMRKCNRIATFLSIVRFIRRLALRIFKRNGIGGTISK